MIEVKLSVMPSVVIEHVTECQERSCSVTYLIMTQLNLYHLLTLPN